MDPIVYYFLLALPVILFVWWYRRKDRKDHRVAVMEHKAHEFLQSPYWIYNSQLLENSDLEIDIEQDPLTMDISPEHLTMIGKEVLGLGALYMCYQIKHLMGANPNDMPEQERLPNSVYCAGRLVRLAKIGDHSTLASLLYCMHHDVPMSEITP